MGKCYQSNWRTKTFLRHGKTRPWDSTRDIPLSILFYRFHTNFQRSLLVLSLLSLIGFFSVKEITKASNCLASRHTHTTSSEQNDNYRRGATQCGSVCYGIFCVSHGQRQQDRLFSTGCGSNPRCSLSWHSTLSAH